MKNSRPPHQAHITRFLKALTLSGLEITTVEMQGDKIIAHSGDKAGLGNSSVNLEQWQRQRDARKS